VQYQKEQKRKREMKKLLAVAIVASAVCGCVSVNKTTVEPTVSSLQ
jgi:hypothetical protein